MGYCVGPLEKVIRVNFNTIQIMKDNPRCEQMRAIGQVKTSYSGESWLWCYPDQQMAAYQLILSL